MRDPRSNRPRSSAGSALLRGRLQLLPDRAPGTGFQQSAAQLEILLDTRTRSHEQESRGHLLVSSAL